MNEIVLRPARRILVIYLLAFLLTLAVLGISLRQLSQAFGIPSHELQFLWNGSAVVGGGLLVYAILWRLTCEFRLSGEYVTGTIGILARQHIRISLSRIVDYHIIRSVFERIIGLGELHIDTAGQEIDKLILQQISVNELESTAHRLDKLLNRDQVKNQGDERMEAF